MKRLGILLLAVTLFACGSNDQAAVEDEENGAFNYENFSDRFTAATLPYQLSDTGLLKNKDTAGIRNATFTAFIPDSIKQKLVGKSTGVKFVPLAKIETEKAESYYVMKAVSGSRTAALLVVFDKDQNYSASFPFLVPDSKKETFQTSSIDKAYSVSRNMTRRTEDDVTIEGKDVYVYNGEAKDFTLIMTDLLDDDERELINPIDTFARAHKFAGDYTNGERNIVSVRDGRTANELTVFIHFEKENGECKGELKGNVLMTSSTTAVYRQGGNPCVLEMKFANNKVTLKEVDGCGSFRDLKCTFDGTYTRKKVPKKDTNTATNDKK